MHNSSVKLEEINKEISNKVKELNLTNYNPKIIAVSKTFSAEKIRPLIDVGHIDFGENKVQEAAEKWQELKTNDTKLHLIGRLQTNKVKIAVKLFDFIHSLDNEKLARKLSDELKKINKNIKIFIQVNFGEENQKAGINQDNVTSFYNYCTKNLNLNIIGTMCIPPFDQNPEPFFKQLQEINKTLNLNELSMGMSADYLLAVKCGSTFLRIGSKIFGERS